MKVTTEENKEIRIKYNKLVARDGDEFIFLDEVFQYSGSFKGAVGTRITVIPKDEYEERMEDDDYWYERWQEAVASNRVTEGLNEWVDSISEVEKKEVLWDHSYMHEYWPILREMGYSEEEYPVMDCTGGGRCFSKGDRKKYEQLYNEELWDIIDQYETI